MDLASGDIIMFVDRNMTGLADGGRWAQPVDDVETRRRPPEILIESEAIAPIRARSSRTPTGSQARPLPDLSRVLFERPVSVCRDDGHLSRRRELPDEPSRGSLFRWRTALLTAPRRELVVCMVALSWSASRVRSDRQDVATLYSAQFRDILGATVRHRRKGVVEVLVEDGPTLSFRVAPEAADALQAHVEQAAQSQ